MRRRGKKCKYLAMMTGLSEGLLHSAKIIPSLRPRESYCEEWEDRCVLSEGRIGRVWSFLRQIQGKIGDFIRRGRGLLYLCDDLSKTVR